MRRWAKKSVDCGLIGHNAEGMAQRAWRRANRICFRHASYTQPGQAGIED
jgi:hypothetical protein